MKISLLLGLVVVLISFQESTSFFFAASVVIRQAKDLSSAINKCSTVVQQFSPTLCSLVKTTLKPNRDDFAAAANSLTDIQYLFEDVQNFYGSFLSCLNEQNETASAKTIISELKNIGYQLDVHILTVITTKLAASADPIGAVFGDNVKNVIATIALQYAEEFTIIRTSIDSLISNFQAIIDKGGELTVDSITADIDLSVLDEMITAFKDIAVTSLQVNVVMKGFVVITSTLDEATKAVQETQSVSTNMIKKSNYDLDISIQAARTKFTRNILAFQSDVTDSFGVFFKLSSTIFTGDVDIQDSRVQIDGFMIAINDQLEATSDAFVTIFTGALTSMTTEIQNLKETAAKATSDVTDFLYDAVKMNSASFIGCMEENSVNFQMVLDLVNSLGVNASKCISIQTNVSLEAASLMTFIVEDVVLNVEGSADKLCGCSINSGIVEVEKSKKCIGKITDDMSGALLKGEMDYLTLEIASVQENVTAQIDLFKTCTANATNLFESSFLQVQNTLKACLSV